MPSVSKAQKSLSCMALAMKKGEMKPTYSEQARKMMESMSMEELEKLCHGSSEGLPEKKEMMSEKKDMMEK